jgi:hypothetical protein
MPATRAAAPPFARLRPSHAARAGAALASLLLLLLHPAPAAAKRGDAPDGSTPAKGVSPVTVSEQLSVGPLGLTVFLPENVEASTNSVPGGRTTTTIRPAGQADRIAWLIRIYNLKTADETLTAAEVADSFINEQKARLNARRFEFLLLDRIDASQDKPLRIGENELPAARFYNATKPTDGILSGYTIVRVDPGRFIVFQLNAGALGEDAFEFDPSKPSYGNQSVNLYETVVASMVYEDPALARQEETRRFLAGSELLDTVDTDDLKAIVEANPEPIYLRIYKPAETGADADATEVAFQKITFKLGQLGELETTTPRSSWTPKQREFGLLVAVEAKAKERDITAETQARYFLSIDRKEEFWLTTTVQRRGQARFVARETLIRRGNAITVSVTEDGRPPFTRDWNLAEHDNRRFYISRVELYLLPLLIADRYGDTPTDLDFNFYAYDSTLRRLTQRTDHFSNRDIDGWQYDSRKSPDGDMVTTVLDTDGRIIRRQPTDDIVVERTTRQRLARIWLNKDLPRID